MLSPYREYAPHPVLAPYVQCYWSIAPSPLPLINRILPDGCMDILVSLSATACEMIVIGAMQTAELFSLDNIHTLVGVRFKPGGALPFLRLPVYELTDTQITLYDMNNWLDPCLPEQLYEAPTIPAKITRLEAALLRRYADLPPVDALMSNALHLLRASAGTVGVNELVTQVALSERQLERRFRHHTGLSPKMFARVTRFRAAIITLQQNPTLPLDNLAQDTGFYDQAHFIHDFKAFSGITPTEYLAEQQDVGFLQYAARLP